MFKKLLIISLLIPVYSFSSENSLSALTEREKELVYTVDLYRSDRESDCAWALFEGLAGCSLLAAWNDSSIKKSEKAAGFSLALGLVFAGCFGGSLARVVQSQRRINKDSRELSKVQEGLRRLRR